MKLTSFFDVATAYSGTPKKTSSTSIKSALFSPGTHHPKPRHPAALRTAASSARPAANPSHSIPGIPGGIISNAIPNYTASGA
jgi:hypothetical protein